MQSTESAISPAHAANMARKALRFAKHLTDQGVTDLDLIERMGDPGWELVAEQAGESIPGAATRAIVVVLLRDGVNQ